MNETKLTVRVPRDLLEGAKRYAAQHDTTLTRLILAYLERLESEAEGPLRDAPIVRRLSGVLPLEASVDDYHEHLEQKYGASASRADRP